jgi:hypothetical protein
MLRALLLAGIGIVACVLAIVRYYTRAHPPMVVPMAIDAGSDADGTEGERPIDLSD